LGKEFILVNEVKLKFINFFKINWSQNLYIASTVYLTSFVTNIGNIFLCGYYFSVTTGNLTVIYIA
jgi:hypothetical protein